LLAADLDKLSFPSEKDAFFPSISVRRGEWNDAFGNHQQQDANEALLTLLTACDPRDNKLRVFQGSMRTQLLCHQCHRRAARCDSFGSLEFALPDQGHTTLDALLKQYCSSEFVSDFRCHENVDGQMMGCGSTGSTSKTFIIDQEGWPTAMVINLKRFAFNWSTKLYDKIATVVDFPETWIPQANVVYSLRAVLVHHGHFVNAVSLRQTGGHYTAYVRDSADTWYHCNDNLAPRALQTSEEVLRAQAYMLFYVR